MSRERQARYRARARERHLHEIELLRASCDLAQDVRAALVRIVCYGAQGPGAYDNLVDRLAKYGQTARLAVWEHDRAQDSPSEAKIPEGCPFYAGQPCPGAPTCHQAIRPGVFTCAICDAKDSPIPGVPWPE